MQAYLVLAVFEMVAVLAVAQELISEPELQAYPRQTMFWLAGSKIHNPQTLYPTSIVFSFKPSLACPFVGYWKIGRCERHHIFYSLK